MDFCANNIKKEAKIMNYYPSKCEIYSNLLKKHIMKKIKSTQKNDNIIKKLVKVKILEALFSPLYMEATDIRRFIEDLFMRIKAVCVADKKHIGLAVKGTGSFYIDRRLLTYIILELAANGSEIIVKITPLGLIICGKFSVNSNLELLFKKCWAVRIKRNNTIGIALKYASVTDINNFCGVIESLENEFSPEYLWL